MTRCISFRTGVKCKTRVITNHPNDSLHIEINGKLLNLNVVFMKNDIVYSGYNVLSIIFGAGTLYKQ